MNSWVPRVLKYAIVVGAVLILSVALAQEVSGSIGPAFSEIDHAHADLVPDHESTFAGNALVITLPRLRDKRGKMGKCDSSGKCKRSGPPPKLADADHKTGPICGSDRRLYRSAAHLAHENWLHGTSVIRMPMSFCFPRIELPPKSSVSRDLGLLSE